MGSASTLPETSLTSPPRAPRPTTTTSATASPTRCARQGPASSASRTPTAPWTYCQGLVHGRLQLGQHLLFHLPQGRSPRRVHPRTGRPHHPLLYRRRLLHRLHPGRLFLLPSPPKEHRSRQPHGRRTRKGATQGQGEALHLFRPLTS